MTIARLDPTSGPRRTGNQRVPSRSTLMNVIASPQPSSAREAISFSGLDEIAATLLKSEIAGIARPDPRPFESGARGRICTIEAMVDRVIVPGFDAGRLPVEQGKRQLRCGPGDEARIGKCRLRCLAGGRDRQAGAADR